MSKTPVAWLSIITLPEAPLVSEILSSVVPAPPPWVSQRAAETATQHKSRRHRQYLGTRNHNNNISVGDNTGTSRLMVTARIRRRRRMTGEVVSAWAWNGASDYEVEAASSKRVPQLPARPHPLRSSLLPRLSLTLSFSRWFVTITGRLLKGGRFRDRERE